MDPEQALNYQPEFLDLDDDGLGWYEDGVKRTLTDEQIAMFRHSETEQLKREQRARLESEALDEEHEEDDDDYEPPEVVTCDVPDPAPQSPVSDVSSLEDELCVNKATAKHKRLTSHTKGKQQHAQSSRSRSAHFLRALSPRSRQRKAEVPYDQRHKRKWEDFIDAQDPMHGAMTHRRMVRELDQHRDTNVSMDYGDEELAQPPPTRPPHMPGRRIISYEDD